MSSLLWVLGHQAPRWCCEPRITRSQSSGGPCSEERWCHLGRVTCLGAESRLLEPQASKLPEGRQAPRGVRLPGAGPLTVNTSRKANTTFGCKVSAEEWRPASGSPATRLAFKARGGDAAPRAVGGVSPQTLQLVVDEKRTD